MGLFSMFKTPINETLDIICKVYKNKLRETNNSKIAFIEMANEAFKQAKKHNQHFESPTATYKFLTKGNFDSLTASHNENKEAIQGYLFNMMMYIRQDYYKPVNLAKNENLKVLIDVNLNV